MNNNNLPLQLSPDKTNVFLPQTHSNITNVSAIWWPGVSIPKAVRGLTSATICLCAEKSWLKLGLLRQPDGRQTVSICYNSSVRKSIVRPTPVPTGEYVCFEIDVNPKSSQVTFWVNDRGLDMGVLPGFEGGGQQAFWVASATSDAHLISGKFSDCAFATQSGWIACDMSENDLGRYNVLEYHQLEVLSRNSFALSDKRSAA